MGIRAQKRAQKAAAISPRPLGHLRPVVHACTQKYASKTKLGRGFTLEEVKLAGLTAAFARSVGIAVDHRRRNKSAEAQALNVARLTNYKTKLVLFPRKENKPKKGMINDSTQSAAALAALKQVSAPGLPVAAAEAPVFEPLTKDMKAHDAHKQGRDLRLEKRDHGRKQRKAELKAAAKK